LVRHLVTITSSPSIKENLRNAQAKLAVRAKAVAKSQSGTRSAYLPYTIKAAPPLIIEDDRPDEFVRAITEAVEEMHARGTFWPEALGIARPLLNI